MTDDMLTTNDSFIEINQTAGMTVEPGGYIGNSNFIQPIITGWSTGVSFGEVKPSRRKVLWGRKKTNLVNLQVKAFFKIVKKGLTRKEKKEYQKLAEEAFQQAIEHARIGQKNVAERFEKIMSLNLKKAAAQVKGYTLVIHEKQVEKYRDHLPDCKRLVIDPLDEYDKPLPRSAKIKLSAAKKENIFDTFCVFWIEEVKDPILFGQFNEDPDVYYHIAEWDDDISVEDLLKYK